MVNRYQISWSRDRQYYFELISANNQTVLVSETYTTKAACQNGIASCKAHSPYDNNYRRLNASNGLPYFILKAGNGETIGVSETYSTSYARDQGIETCRRIGPNATVVDKTVASS